MLNELKSFASKGQLPRCRLCDGSVLEKFQLRILDKYFVSYYECADCHSLQTEDPYWLDEAYRSNLSNLDTSAAQRNLTNLAASYLVAKTFKLTNTLDYGGGDGLLCRLLRDYGLNCFLEDKYAKPTYAQGFTDPDFKRIDLLLSFEVLEHFSDPRNDVRTLFEHDAKVVFISTERYSCQNKAWQYLAPSAGTHVFFYSASAINLIARTYKYKPIICGSYVVFVRPELVTNLKIKLIKLLLRPGILRVTRLLILALPARGTQTDFQRIYENDS